MKKDRIVRQCQKCGKDFETRPYLVSKRGKGKFCGQLCYWEAKVGTRRNVIQKKCLICKKIFFRNKYYFDRAFKRGQAGAGKYCSRACLGIANGQRNKERHWNWKGGITLRNLSDKKYRLWRNAVLSRDENKCTECPNLQNLEAHHKKSWKYFPKLRFIISNGQTLCKDCHVKTDSWGMKNRHQK